MKKKLPVKTIVISSIILIVYFSVYAVLTPLIRGTVIDAETGKPIENAWVFATIDKGVRTIAGDVGSTRMISFPHTRTNKNGIFYVPPRLYFSIPTPFSFGMTAESLIITVRAADGRRAQVDLSKNLWKWWFSARILVAPKEMQARDRFRELQDLYHFCMEGAFLLVVPKNQGGCDKWELDYTIREIERYVKHIGKPTTVLEETDLGICLHYLALLYERRGDLVPALETLKHVRDFDLKRGMDSHIREYQEQIRSLEEQLKEKR